MNKAMPTETIREKIIIKPEYIDYRLNDYILSRLKEREHTCTKYGYIKQILSTKIISSEEISMADCSISFTIEWSAVIIMPEKNQTYVASKFLIHLNNRILMDVDNMFNCLVINGRSSGKFYVFDGCSCKVDIEKIDTSLDVVLIEVEFKDGKFVTIGEHRHKN